MLVAAEGGLGGLLVFAGVAWQLEFEGAELVVDDVPDDFVGSHGWFVRCAGGRGGDVCWSSRRDGYRGCANPKSLVCGVYVKKERRFKLIFRQARETAEKGLESEKFGLADRGMACLRLHYIVFD